MMPRVSVGAVVPSGVVVIAASGSGCAGDAVMALAPARPMAHLHAALSKPEVGSQVTVATNVAGLHRAIRQRRADHHDEPAEMGVDRPGRSRGTDRSARCRRLVCTPAAV